MEQPQHAALLTNRMTEETSENLGRNPPTKKSTNTTELPIILTRHQGQSPYRRGIPFRSPDMTACPSSPRTHGGIPEKMRDIPGSNLQSPYRRGYPVGSQLLRPVAGAVPVHTGVFRYACRNCPRHLRCPRERGVFLYPRGGSHRKAGCPRERGGIPYERYEIAAELRLSPYTRGYSACRPCAT